MLKKAFFLSCLCLSLTGCSLYNIDSQDTTLDFYPPKGSADTIVYYEKVEKPHEIIGIVSVDVERSKPFDEVLAKMRYEASVLGGDAITDVRNSSQDQNKINASLRSRYTAKVIAFK